MLISLLILFFNFEVNPIYFQTLLLKVGLLLAGRVLLSFLRWIGLSGNLSWAVGFALRTLLDLEVETSPLGHHMMPHTGAGSAASSSEELDLDLKLGQPGVPVQAPLNLSDERGSTRNVIEYALFKQSLARRDTLKDTLAALLLPRIQEEYAASPEGAPSAEDCVEAIIARWGGGSEKIIRGNCPWPTKEDLASLNRMLQQAVNSLDAPLLKERK